MQPRSLRGVAESQISGFRLVLLLLMTAHSVVFTIKPRDGTFFFVSFQLARNCSGDPQLRIVLTAANWGGDLSSIPSQIYKKGGQLR
jgi:hypothetical protein